MRGLQSDFIKTLFGSGNIISAGTVQRAHTRKTADADTVKQSHGIDKGSESFRFRIVSSKLPLLISKHFSLAQGWRTDEFYHQSRNGCDRICAVNRRTTIETYDIWYGFYSAEDTGERCRVTTTIKCVDDSEKRLSISDSGAFAHRSATGWAKASPEQQKCWPSRYISQKNNIRREMLRIVESQNLIAEAPARHATGEQSGGEPIYLRCEGDQ